MNNEDKKIIDEVIDLPEAPYSTHVDCYYKGFHVGITIRAKDNTKVTPAILKENIERLIESGFEPSWNKDTTKDHLKASEGTTAPHETYWCDIHGVEMKKGVSKKTNKPYFYHRDEGKMCFGQGYKE